MKKLLVWWYSRKYPPIHMLTLNGCKVYFSAKCVNVKVLPGYVFAPVRLFALDTTEAAKYISQYLRKARLNGN